MDMWGHHLPNDSFPVWSGVWGPVTFWRRFCRPPASLPSMSWDRTTLAAFRLSTYLVSSRLVFRLRWCVLCSLRSPLLVVPGKDSKAEVSPASPVALVPEEKVSFSFCALSVSTLTVAKIRKVYNKLDSKAIAKQVRYT